MWKFPSERLAEKIADTRKRIREEGRQEGRQATIQELRDKGVEIPAEMEAKEPEPDKPDQSSG